MEKLTLEQRLERLLNAYSHRYDIDRNVEVEGCSFPATATYFLRDENYLISKKHVLSAVENYEYMYFHLTDRLTAEVHGILWARIPEWVAISFSRGSSPPRD